MSATYDPTLATDKDWVRFLVGDRSTSSALLQDEEIAALLAEEANKYLAAARAGECILAQGHGVASKSVADLSLSYEGSPEAAYRSHLQRLREKGCQKLLEVSGSAVARIW